MISVKATIVNSYFFPVLSSKHIALFYRILDDSSEIEYFWGNFDDSEKINQLLKLN